MARKDLIQDTDRPHYYSQYWIDVAMGKQKPIAPMIEPEIEADAEDDLVVEAPAPKPVAQPRAAKPVEKKPEPAPRPTLTSFADLANIEALMKSSAEMGDDQTPDIEAGVGAVLDDAIATNFDLDALAAEPEAEPAFASEDDEFADFEEEDEEDEWGNTRRSKKGPTKPAKRRERRDF